MDALRRFIAVSLLLAATPGIAATIHKCRLADGRVVYQDADCARSARVLASWDTPPDPPLPASAKRAGAAAPSTRGSSGSRRRSATRTVAAADACAAAKARRDATEARVGLARTYELLSALQRDVYDACR